MTNRTLISPSSRPRGRILHPNARERIYTAINTRFPIKNYPRIYEGTSNLYNFLQLAATIQANAEQPTLNNETLKKILQRGVDDPGVDFSSIEKLFAFFNEPLDKQKDTILLDKSIPPIYINRSTPKDFCNLPQQDSEFIGRETELEKLRQYLDPESRPFIITIDGVGGVGKTSLAIEVAYRCLESNLYDAVVFVSFKAQWLHPGRGIKDKNVPHDLDAVCRAIAETLKDESIVRAIPAEQVLRVYNCLKRQKTLLIIDDLQSSDDEEQDRIIDFLQDLPPGTKAIVTTRHRVSRQLSHVRLDCLSEQESLKLLAQQLKQHDLELSEKRQKQLHNCYRGIPVALVYVIGQLNNCHSIEDILGENQQCPSAQQDVGRFCFEQSINSFRETHSHTLLKAIAIFHFPPITEALVHVSGVNTFPNTALAEIQCFSLAQKKHGRYVMLSVTREYILECNGEANTVRDMTERWFQWYLSFSQKHGGTDWGYWRDNYDFIEAEWENLLSVLHWCASLNRYEDVKELWKYLNHFADLYGYWSDRLTWLNWLITQSWERGDRETFVSSLSKKGWTLTMMGQPENLNEAEKLFDKAWKYREDACLKTQDYLAHNMAVMYTRAKKYEEAHKKLSEKQDIERNLGNEEPDETMLTRHRLNTIRDFAKLHFCDGNLEDAKQSYEILLTEATEINWKRMVCYAHYMLAELSIKEQNFTEARKHLISGIRIAVYNKNKRRYAYYMLSFAKVEKEIGKRKTVQKQAGDALKTFQQLGMEQEAKQVQELFNLT
jgi:hypothetical protein